MPILSNTPSDTNRYLPYSTYNKLPHHSFNDNFIRMDQGHRDAVQMPFPSLKRNNTYPDDHQTLSGYPHMARSLPQYYESPIATSPEEHQLKFKDPRASLRVSKTKAKRSTPCERCRGRHGKCIFTLQNSCSECIMRNEACSGPQFTEKKKRRISGAAVIDRQSRSNSTAAPAPESTEVSDGVMPDIKSTDTGYAPSESTNTLSATSLSSTSFHNLQRLPYDPSAYPHLNNYDPLDGMHYLYSDGLFGPVDTNTAYALSDETTNIILAMGISGMSSHNPQSYYTLGGMLYPSNDGLSGTTSYGMTRYSNA